ALRSDGPRGAMDACRLFAAPPGSATPERPRCLAFAFEEASELLGARRVPELAQRLRFDLPDTLARDIELLADFFQRVVGVHLDLLGQERRIRLLSGLLQDLPRDAVHLVDRLDHVHGDADGARLIGDRARDGLPDPPRGVGREFVAAAVFELVDRLHQPDVAFLDQVEELQAAVGVLLGDRDHEPEVGLDHLLLRLPRLALALLNRVHALAEFADLKTSEFGKRMDFAAQVLDA